MNKRQRKMNRRIWLEINGRYLLILTLILLALGWVGMQDSKTELYETTITMCEADASNCQDLINEVQKDSHVEVLSSEGRYWIETK